MTAFQGSMTVSLLLMATIVGAAREVPFTNLEIPGDPIAFSERWLLVLVEEEAQGRRDLNEDGDTGDAVLHVHDLQQGVTTNLQLASYSFEAPPSAESEFFSEHWVRYGAVAGHRLVFTVTEWGQGRRDLNGDGDTDDAVLHVHDLETHRTTNLRLTVNPCGDINLGWHFRSRNVLVLEDRIVFSVPERTQGDRDLNGDGDTDDAVVHVHHFATAVTVNLGLAVDGCTVRCHGVDSEVSYPFRAASARWLCFTVPEISQGKQDLNGDGDTDDYVLHVYDMDTKVIANLAFSTYDFECAGNRLAFVVSEREKSRDLNGDGDVIDRVVHVRDLESESTANLRMAVLEFSLAISESWLSFLVPEADQGGQDLNGDGNLGEDRDGDGDISSWFEKDQVLHAHDLEAGVTTNLKLLVDLRNFSLRGSFHEMIRGRLVFQVDEVLHVHDLEEGTTTSLGIPSGVFRVTHRWLVFWRRGWPDILHACDLETGITKNLGIKGGNLAMSPCDLPVSSIAGNRVVIPNAVHDLELGKTLVLAEDMWPTSLAGKWLLFQVHEATKGQDLNDDGDLDDDVLHVLDTDRFFATPEFQRGDANSDSHLNITDAIFILGYLFRGGKRPPCLDAADANDDAAIDIADAVAVLSHLFSGGGDLPEPFRRCGVDPTFEDPGVGCERYPPCEGQ